MNKLSLWLRQTYLPQFLTFSIVMLVLSSIKIGLNGSERVISLPKLILILVSFSLVFGLFMPFLIKSIELFFYGLARLFKIDMKDKEK